jgi:type I restriction enzyme R subunit
VLEDAPLKKIATIDRTIRESVAAKLMVLLRRTLNKYGYPPDKQQKAVDTVRSRQSCFPIVWFENDIIAMLNFAYHFARND